MPMYQNQVADKDLGYVKVPAGGADAAVLVSSFFPGAVIPLGTKLILISPETQALRVRSDGTAPTTTVGYPVAVLGELRYTAGQMNALQIISQVAGAAVNIWALG